MRLCVTVSNMIYIRTVEITKYTGQIEGVVGRRGVGVKTGEWERYVCILLPYGMSSI